MVFGALEVPGRYFRVTAERVSGGSTRYLPCAVELELAVSSSSLSIYCTMMRITEHQTMESPSILHGFVDSTPYYSYQHLSSSPDCGGIAYPTNQTATTPRKAKSIPNLRTRNE